MIEIRKFEGLQIETDEGYKDFDGLACLGEQDLLTFTLEDNSTISVTYHHVFVIDDLEVEACELNIGEVLESQNCYKTIINIETGKKELVFDVLEVKDTHRYFANNILNHNCKFIGSTNTLIDSEVLERLETIDPIDTKWNGILQIFEHPIPNAFYIMGIDSSEGIGHDYAVIQILKINSELDIEQVAVFRTNTLEISKFAQISVSISEYYNNANMMIENNGVGSLVADIIWNDHECDAIINCDAKGLGIRATKKTKLNANLLLKRYLESHWLKLVDRQTIYELSLYEEIKPNIYQSPEYAHDDSVTSLLWALYFVTTELFDGKNVGIKSIEDKFKIDDRWDSDAPIVFTDQDADDPNFDDD